MCFGVACMSKRVSSSENALYNFLSEEYVRIPLFKEIQCCRAKTTTNVLDILNLDEKKSLIVRNYLVFPKQQDVTLCALGFCVFLSLYHPQSCNVQFSVWWKYANTTFIEIQCCRVKTNTNVLEILNCAWWNPSVCEIIVFFLNNMW